MTLIFTESARYLHDFKPGLFRLSIGLCALQIDEH